MSDARREKQAARLRDESTRMHDKRIPTCYHGIRMDKNCIQCLSVMVGSLDIPNSRRG